VNNPGKHTYGQILKSSVLIGSSSVLNMGLGFIRTKAMAVLLGTTGYGLMGLYGQVQDLTRTVAGVGMNNSGVRQIAAAVGTGDSQRVARTVTTLRRVAFGTGALGALLLAIFRHPISRMTFGDDNHAGSIALLAVAVFFGDISAAQGALVQGMRKIADLARISVLGAFYGTLFSIVIVYYFYRQGAAQKGVVPSLVCVAGMAILTSWWYARKIKVERPVMTTRQVVDESSELLKLGVVFMARSLMTLGATYLIVIMVRQKISLGAVGCFQAAWALGGQFTSFILEAMGADFYPRLTAVANDNVECNRLVNEQAEVGLLLAGPGVIATLTFAPLVIQLFYTAEFGPAAEILRWICLGMMLRVASWPMGFILIAKGERQLYFWTELLGNLTFISLVWAGISVYSLKGTGMAFFGMYIVYSAGIYLVVRRLSGFRWSKANRQLAFLFVPLVATVFVSWYFLPRAAVAIAGAAITIGAGVYSLKTLCKLIPLERLPRVVQKLVVLFRLASPETIV